MEDMVTLEMLVEKSIADEISQKGLAEIALRRADAKFKAMVKCRLLDHTVLEDGIPQRIVSSAMQLDIPNIYDKESVRGAIRSLENKFGNQIYELSSTTKNMAIQVDGIYQLTNSVRSLSYLNTGLSLANMAVDVAGFAVVNEKLNTLNSEVHYMVNQVNRVINIQKNNKIAMCQKLIMRFNSVSSKIQNFDEINLDNLELLIMDMRGFISEMIMDLQDEALGTELVLKIIFSLLPTYTLLFNEFIKRYYFEKHKLPANYGMFLKLYDEVENANFRDKLVEYFFIKEKKHSQDVIDLLNAQTLLSLNGKVQIEDQALLLQMLGTKETVEAFDKRLNGYVKSQIREKAPIIAERSGVDQEECRLFFMI